MRLSCRLAVAALALSGVGAVFAQSSPPYVWTSADGQTMRLRNSSGAIASISMPQAAVGVPDGNGGLGLRAAQTIDVGASRIPLTLKRAVTVGNLARGAMFAARALGPIALVGLAYEGVRYAQGEWEKSDSIYASPSNGEMRSWRHDYGSQHPCGDFEDRCSFSAAVEAAQVAASVGFQSDVKFDTFSGTCTTNLEQICNIAASGTYQHTSDPPGMRSAIGPRTIAGYGSDGAGDSFVPASDDDLIISFQQGLIANPGKAGDVAQSVSGAGHADKLLPGSLIVEGPVQVQGPTTTTTTNTPSGTETTVTNTVYNITYQGDTVNIDASVTTTTTHPDGSVTTSTTTTSGSPSPAEQTGPENSEEGGAIVDPELPPIPELYQRKYPEGIVGVWNDKREGFDQSPFFQLIGKLAPSNLGDGGCPSWSLPLSLESWAPYGTHTLQVPCWVWTAIRALMIVGALLIARRLIFGG